MAKIKINEAEFYYELHGKGQPLILISGYGADHLFWMPILDLLTRHFQVLIFDNRAIGQTKDQSTDSLTADSMADDVMSLAEALGLNNPHIVGQSMGGTIAQSIASRYPQQINKVGIFTSSSKWRQALLRGLKSLLLMRKENVSFDCWFETMLGWVFGEKFLENTEQVELVRFLLLNNPYPPSLTDQERQYGVISEFDGRDGLKKITAQTLVVYGVQDIISLPHESKKIADSITNAKLVGFDCAHGLIAEVPKELSNTMVEFFTA